MKHLAVFLFLAPLAPADSIGIGMRGGLPFGDAFESARSRDFTISGHNRFVLGPTLELRLPLGFGASFDALYRRYNFETISSTSSFFESGGQWEFPLMLRYRFPGIVARPFVAAGPVFQKITGVTSTRNSSGVALGGGLDIKIPLFHITPEIRYSRRFQEPFITLPLSGLRANANQFDFMLGITF
ncbi:MAG TPA: outer membrane beta-barrel protein [Bryobacteraceae bacterium]|nr:outer membrane beta-barrel protein [Bryobacteraceae bacterium]